MSVQRHTQAAARLRAIELLSFVHQPNRRTARVFWNVPDVPDYTMQWKLGEALGREFLAFFRRFEELDDPTMLSSIASDMIRRGNATGI